MSVNAVLAGSTGLVVCYAQPKSTLRLTQVQGSQILQTLVTHPSVKSVQAFSRRKLSLDSPKLTNVDSTDSGKWPTLFPKDASIFFSGLGTTRAQAGSLAEQRKIDLDLNLELAKAAKAAGVQTYVLISSGSANANSMLPYSKMKGELEEGVKALGFKHTVVLRPGLIVGDREDSRPPEFVFRKIAGLMGTVLGNKGKDFWAQDASVIAKAAINAGLQCDEGKHEEGFWLLGQSDIVRLGRTEWKEPEL